MLTYGTAVDTPAGKGIFLEDDVSYAHYLWRYFSEFTPRPLEIFEVMLCEGDDMTFWERIAFPQ